MHFSAKHGRFIDGDSPPLGIQKEQEQPPKKDPEGALAAFRRRVQEALQKGKK